MYPRYQDSFLFYQNPQYLQNNSLLLSPPPHYNSHFLADESRICNPSQPCFMAKQTGAFSQAETFSSNGGPQLPFNYTADPRTLLPTSSAKLSIPEPPTSSDIIHHPLPVYFRVKPALRTPSGKRCRKSRTVFTDLQLRVLEKTFSEQRYLDSTNRAKLSHILGLNEAQVKTWFQNRRMKWKKKVAKTGEKPDSSTTTKKAEKTDQAAEKNNKETATSEREKNPN
ncbi:homeobox protein ceh-31-like [Oculina patagonica]